MEQLLQKYQGKLVAAGLCDPEGILLCGMDDRLSLLGDLPEEPIITGLFDRLSINAVLFARPREPYASIIDFLARESRGSIRPGDTETRTFLHELPVVDRFHTEALTDALSRRKSAIIPGHGVVTFGTVSPEQAFVVFSSVLFATFVKYFSDHLKRARAGTITSHERALFARIVDHLKEQSPAPPTLMSGPLDTEQKIIAGMCEAGRATVTQGLVDSYFGNISFFHDQVIHISQTGSSLDELEGLIDPVPLDSSSCAGVTASSELSAHREVYLNSSVTNILHGHPRFSVIMSMDCPHEQGCSNFGECHRKCSRERFVEGVPIVPGEVGTGVWGIARTLPPVLARHKRAIVYGHGLFTAGGSDFNGSFRSLYETEQTMRAAYFNAL